MKLTYFGTNKPLNYYETEEQIIIPENYQEKPFRAFWVSNVLNIDLPTTQDPNYQQKVIQMLDTAKAYHMTAIFFQVRTTNDAFYKSKFNPYSKYLTGKEGVAPKFDRSEEHTSELQSRPHLVCRLLLEKKKKKQ